MTSAGRGWNEDQLSESPAVAQLQKLGFTYVAPEVLEGERASLKEVVLTGRLAAALKRLNPWLSDDNLQRAIRSLTSVSAAGLLEANEKLYTALTYGISLEQDLGPGLGGKRARSVRFIDFESPPGSPGSEANELVVTRQYRVQGAKKQIVPDVVVLINGLPLVVIECKSPTLGKDWKREAVDQLWRYQELGSEYRDLGAPKLFELAQLVVVTCGQEALYGTVGTPQRAYAEWKSTWPNKPTPGSTPQDVLFAGLLTPTNLLDVIRNFTAFERDPSSGRTVRKLCRYQQFAAVNKALTRVKTATSPAKRGGVVWHTQGSGKSLTMLWLAMKLRREPALGNPTLVLVTDRRDLDDQISTTFRNCGFPNPERAESVRDLRERLHGAVGKTVLTTVQKFQEVTGVPAEKPRGSDDKRRRPKQSHPVLSEAENLFVLSDEAHRTQYGSLAGNLRAALPNACFFGFTGTPIDKNDRSTLETFGPYIDTYTIEQAVQDGATVPIFYEGRLPEVRLLGQSLDQLFDRVFADRTDEERVAIRKKYGTEAAVAGAPKRIEAICLDLIDHYTKFIRPNGFKAQLVAVSREAAATYKETLERLNAPQSALLVSTSNKDDERLIRLAVRPEDRKATIDRFCDHGDPLSILVVCDMLLTGFDAPVEQVMYLDSPLKEHTLLQAIARVNRTAEKKDYGLIVDYWGVSEALQEALAIFSPSDVRGALTAKGDELPRLQARHAAALRFFLGVKDKLDLEACVRVLEPEDVRSGFDEAFRAFQNSMDLFLPDPRALAFADDLRWLGKLRQAASVRFRDQRLDISDCGEKVRKLIEEAVVAEGIQVLVKKVSIFSKDFGDRLEMLKTDEAKASEMEHAVRAEIHVRVDEDPAFYKTLREKLEAIIEDRKAKRIDAAQQLLRLQVIVDEMHGRTRAAQSLGLSDTGLAIYGLLHRAVPSPVGRVGEHPPDYNGIPVDEPRRELAALIEEAVAPQLAIVDWVQKDDVQREARARIKRQLRAASFPAERVDGLANEIVTLMKARRR